MRRVVRMGELASEVIERWADARKWRLAGQVGQEQEGMTAIGLESSLAAVNQDAGGVLIVPGRDWFRTSSVTDAGS